MPPTSNRWHVWLRGIYQGRHLMSSPCRNYAKVCDLGREMCFALPLNGASHPVGFASCLFSRFDTPRYNGPSSQICIRSLTTERNPPHPRSCGSTRPHAQHVGTSRDAEALNGPRESLLS